MTVYSKSYPGLLHICKSCYALLGYSAADIYEKKYIYCPLCKEKNEVKPIQEVPSVN